METTRRTSQQGRMGGSRALPFLVLVLLVLAGCAATEEAASNGGTARTTAAEAGPRLAAPDTSVRTVQLYAGADERRLPVLRLGRGDGLTLEFDLLVRQGRPLSVYFYHAGRDWERDPVPARYLDGFSSGDVLDYTRARATGVPYVHYVYRFPGDGVDFRASGNYILRVTEQGREDDVLFERPFFVAEEAGALEMDFESLRLGGGPADRPTVRYRPPARLGSNPFDFSACFVPDGRLRRARCVDGPQLSSQPLLTFELPLRERFALGPPAFFLDLSRLQPGGEIAAYDLQPVPPMVVLEEDRAEFAGDVGAPPLDDQPVVRRAGIDAVDAQVSAEYASVRFRFVPPGGRRLQDAVYVTGSFSDGPLTAAPRLRWRPAERRYEGDVLLKQGLYEYRYASPDPRLAEALAQNLPPTRRRYAAFVYYRDAALGSDRLLLVRRAQAE